MNYAYAAYAGLTSALYLSVFPFYWLSKRFIKQSKIETLVQRMGAYSDLNLNLSNGSPRIWIHAVSVGEVRAAHAVINALSAMSPKFTIILSVATIHGYNVALQLMSPHITCIYAPIDFIVPVRKSLSAVKPDALVFMETEIWPNWIMAAYQQKIPIAIVNGRLSSRSMRSYRKIRRLMAETLSCVNAFSMIHSLDADRINYLGAAPERIEINGNAKFDLLAPQTISPVIQRFETTYRLQDRMPVMVAGSVRGDEPRMLLGAYEKVRDKLPKALLIIAPRHMERVPDIVSMVSTKGFSYQLHSKIMKGEQRTARIVVLDTMGELNALYGIATVVFCGGSLVPLGGQNILEAAAWGKPVLYGPFMDDFLDAKQLLEKHHAGIEVKGEQELTEKILYFLSSPQKAAQKGDLAKKAVESCQGAAEKHAKVIRRLLARP